MSTAVSLPCRWRGPELATGRHECGSPKLSAPGGVDLNSHCRSCYCRDHEPVAAVKVPLRAPAAPVRRPLRVTKCAHRSPQPIEKPDCSCAGMGVFACELHEKCTLYPVARCIAAVCSTCPDFESEKPAPLPGPTVPPPLVRHSFPPVERRHLLYHVYPSPSRVWVRGVDQLSLRKHLFDGSRSVAVCTGPGLEPWELVRDYVHQQFGPADVFPVANDKSLREVVSWIPLWERATSAAGPNDAIFYAHAKGATRPVDPGNSCHWWASLLYHVSLDYWPVVADQLTRHPITGALKKLGHGFGAYFGNWHYSGTFYWVRAGDFVKRDWRKIPQRWFGNEAWPGMQYHIDEGGCIFHGGTVPHLNLYDVKYWQTIILPAFKQWRAANAVQAVSVG